MSAADHCTYRVHWSGEDEEYVATVADQPSVSWPAEDRVEAFNGIQRAAKEIVADMRARPGPPAAGHTRS